MLLSTTGQADPIGGQVVSGQGSIVQTGATTTVAQTSPSLSLTWTSFNIAPQETVNFLQPSATAIAVNRIADINGTQILGHLNANGQVYLINPNGILFGSGAQVNVGGLVASTLDVGDASLGQPTRSFRGDGAGAIVNQGTLTAANGGYVALLGQQVTSQGTIAAPGGTVALGAGRAVTLTFSDNSLVQLQVDQGVLNALAQNGGMLQADGGLVIMSAGAKDALLASVVNNTGVIQAQTVENRSGRVILLGGHAAGTVKLSGTIDATGAAAGQSGGTVELLGGQVGLFDHAVVDASGVDGGGTVLIGGDLQGANATISNASATYLGADATIKADALVQGAGGKIILWGNDSTRAYGRVSARGGAQSGDGGLIETSGHWLDVTGLRVDASAATGRRGTWLLDPADVTITGTATTGGAFGGGNPNVFAPDSGAATANVDVSTITTALATTDVTIKSANTGTSGSGVGDITVSAPISWLAPTTLTLTAVHDVTVNQAISGSDGSFIANAGGNINVEAAITTTTGSLTANAGGNVNVDAAMSVTTGNIVAIASNNVSVTAALTVTTGNVVLHADNDGTSAGGAILGGTVGITGAGSMTITTGTADIRFNPAGYANTGAEILAYGGKLIGTGTLDARAWVFATANNKVYDGTVAATARFRGDPTVGGTKTVNLGGGTISFADRNAGATKTANFSGFTISGADAADYALFAGSGTSTAAITQALLSVTAQTDTKVYNGTTDSAVLPLITSGALQTGDTTTTFAQAYDTANVGTGKTLTPAGIVNDGNLGANYAYTLVTDITGVITPKPVTITGTAANSKGYDGNTLATLSNIGAVTTGVGAETLVLNGPVAANINFNAKDVATANLVTGTGYSLANGSGGGLASNYALTSTTASAAAGITPKSMTIAGVAANNKGYDGSTLATLSSSGTVTTGVGAETLVLNGPTAANINFNSKDVVTANLVTGTGYSLSDGSGGGLAGNYTLSSTSASAAANVTSQSVDLSGNRTYDGTVNIASGVLAIGSLIGGETLALTGTGTVASRNVGLLKPLTLGTLALGDGTGLASNYTFTGGTLTAGITQALLTLTAQAASRAYDSTTNSAVSPLITSGALQAGDTTTTFAQSYDTANAGTGKTLTPAGLVNDGNSGANYAYTYVVDTTGVITPKSVTIAGTVANNKGYDGTILATLSNIGAVTTGVGAETLVLNGPAAANINFNSKDVATANLVTGTGYSLSNGSGGGLAGNYALTSSSASAVAGITPQAVDLSGTRTYDGTANVAAGTLTIGSLVGGETLALTGTGSVASRNVGLLKPLTLGTLALGDGTGLASNYTFTGGTQTAGITQALMTVTAQTDTKVYDATTNSAVLPLITTGALQTGDTTTTFAQTYDTANAGTGKTLTPAGIVNDGNSGANYAYTFATDITGVITPKSVTIAGTVANNKGYDGTTLATLSNIGAVTTGVGAETLVLNGPTAANINFNTKDVTTANLVTGTGYSLSNGTGGGLASNYALASSSAGATASITPRSVDLSGARVYDGSANLAAGVLTIGSLVGSETLTLTGTGTVASRNVGLLKPLTLGTLALGDGTGLASNYTFTGGTQTAGITQALLTLTAQTDTRAYDGTTSSAVSPLITTGALQAGDTTTTFAQTYDNANAGTGKTLTPAGLVNDGNSGANYAYTFVADTTGVITPKSVTIAGTAANNKGYDGTTLATLSNIGAVTTGVGAETLVLNGPSAANINFNTKDVATANLVTGTGYSLSNGSGGGLASNYALTSTSASAAAVIAPKSVTIAGMAADSKGYDGTTLATLSNIGAVTTGVGAETLVLNGPTAVNINFNTKNVATANLVTGTGYSLSNGAGGGLADNYVLTSTAASAAANITPQSVDLSGVRAYDGTTNITAGVLTIGSLIGSETLTLTGTGSVASRNVGLLKPLTLGTLALGDGTGLASNYTFAGGTQTAGITQALMTVTAQTDTKGYDRTTSSAVLPLITTGALQSGDTTTTFSQAYSNVNAGTAKTLTAAGLVNDGNSGANYAYTFVADATGVITPKSVTIVGTAANDKGYDGTTLATLSNIGAVTTGVGAETLVLNGPAAANINFNSKDVATANLVTGTGYSISDGTGGGLAGNYALSSTSSSAAANIAPQAVGLSGNRGYDGSTNIAAGVLTIGSLIGSETLSLTGTGTVASRNVGLLKPLALGTLALGNGTGLASNYTFTGGTQTAGITQALMTVTAQTATKVYDATTSSAVLPLITAGALQAGDTTTTFAQTYDNANAGIGKTLTPAGIVNDGNLGANYAYTFIGNSTGTITPASVTIVTIGGVSANNKVYDGSTLATLSNIGAVTTGVGAETLVLNGPAAANINFNTKDVTTANLVTGTGYSLSDGTGGGMASNYALTSTSASAPATITPKSVNLGGNRTYDGSANIAAGTLTIGSLVGSETLTLSGTGTVASRNVGLLKPLTLGTLTLGNGTGQASNYTFTGGTQTAGITQALMTVTAQTATKVYDATTSSAVLPLITAGALQAGDATTTFAQTYNNANAGTGKTLTPAGIVNDGNSGANYAYTFVANNTGVITAAPVTVTGLTIAGTVANNKVYDGTTLATLSNIGTVDTGVSGQTLVLNGPAPANINFNSKDVATANLVTGTGYSLSDGTGGGLASNYTLTSTSASAPARITPKPVNLSGTRTYDGSTNIAAGMLTVGSLVGSETLTLAGTGTVASRNVGAAKSLTLGTLALGNGTGQASNYTFTGGTQTASITPAGLTLSTKDVVKVFDGGVSAQGTAVVAGGTLFSGDTISGGTFAFTTPTVGLGNKTVTTAGVTVTDGNGGANYLVGYVINTTSTISVPRASILSIYASLHPHALSLSPTIAVAGGFEIAPLFSTEAFALETNSGVALNTTTMNNSRHGPVLEIVDPGPDHGNLALTRIPRDATIQSNQ